MVFPSKSPLIQAIMNAIDMHKFWHWLSTGGSCILRMFSSEKVNIEVVFWHRWTVYSCAKTTYFSDLLTKWNPLFYISSYKYKRHGDRASCPLFIEKAPYTLITNKLFLISSIFHTIFNIHITELVIIQNQFQKYNQKCNVQKCNQQ